jgi:hypothetical protein
VQQKETRHGKNCPDHPKDSIRVAKELIKNKLTRKPAGDAGLELRFTAQSRNVWLPRIAKTIIFLSSMGTDLITIDFVPLRQSASTNASRSFPVGLVYTLSEYRAAIQRRGNVGTYLKTDQLSQCIA